MTGIAWRILWRQPGTLIGALVMTTAGAVLLTAFMVLQESVAQTRAPVERFAGAEVVVAGEDGLLTKELIDGVERLPGVAEVVPELSFTALALDADGAPAVDQEETPQLGHSWSSAALTPMAVDEGSPPAADHEIVVDGALAEAVDAEVGSEIAVEVAGTAQTYELAGLASPGGGEAAGTGGGGELEHQHAVFFHPGEAERLADRGGGRSDGAGLFLDPGTDADETAALAHEHVAAGLAGDAPTPGHTESFQVASGSDRGELEGTWPDHSATAGALTLLVWIVAFMAVAVIGGALVTSVRRRAGQFALLRAIGATPRQTRLLCQAETLLISLVAVVLGSVLGVLLGWVLVGVFRELGVVSSVLTVGFGAAPLLTSAALLIAVAQAAAWLSARSALRIRPGEALGGEAERADRRSRVWPRVACGVLSLAAAGVLQALGMTGLLPPVLYSSYGMIASGLVMVGIGLLGSWIIHAASVLLRRPVAAVSGAGGYLAAANVRFHHRRYAGVAAPLAVGVAISGWALSGLPLFALNNADETADRFDAEYVLRTPIVREAHTGLSEEVRERVPDVSGVDAVAGLRDTWVHAQPAGSEGPADPGDATRGTVVSGAASQVLDLGGVRGDLTRVDSGDGVALGAAYADLRGLDVGDDAEIRVSGASQVTEVEVAAVFERDQGGQDGLVIAEAALGNGSGSGWHDFVLVSGNGGGTADGIDRGALESEVSTAGTVVVEDRAGFRQTYVAEREGAIDNLGTVATVLVGVFLVVAAVNALALSASDRRSELGSMRRLSMTPAQINGVVGWEMVLTVVPAWLLGVAATAWMALAMAGGDVGAALWAFPWAVLSLLGAFGLLIAVWGALTAARGVLRSVSA